MTSSSRLLALVALAVTVGCLALGPPAPAAAQAPPAITPPPEWAEWDLNQDDQLTVDEFQQLSDADQETLQRWIDDTLDAVDDNDFREWASEHFDFATGLLVDIPSPGVADQVRDAPGEVSDSISGAVSDAASGVADSAFDAVASRVGEAAAELTGYIGDEMARTGRPQLEADWYMRHYQRMLGWAGLLLLPLAGLGIGGAVIRGDSAKVGHIFMQIPAVYLMGVLAISAVSAASGLAAAMSRSLVPGMQDASHDLGARVTELMERGLVPGLVLLLGLFIALAAIMTLLWLLMAEAAIYAVVLFVPLAFAGRVWEPAKDWGRKLLTIAFSLVAAKVVIFAIWALTVDGLASASANDVPLRSALALAALLLMTALAVPAALRLVPMLEGVERAGSPGGAARSGMSTAYYGAGLARMGSATLGSGRGGGGGGGLAVTGQIGGAAARAPAGAGGAGAGNRASSGVPASRGGAGRAQNDRQGGTGDGRRDPDRAGGRERGGDDARRAAPGAGRSTSGSRPMPAQGPAGSAAPASRPPGGTSISDDTPRAAPPALPPGTGGSGSPWRRQEP